MNWSEVFAPDYSVFDFETSGLSEELDHIIEIGLLEVRNNSPRMAVSWVVNPNFPQPFHVTNEITVRTGITDTELTYGADPRELFPSFMERIRWQPIWGHNILRFDMPFINEECKRMCTIPPPKSSWFDTAAIFKAWQLSLPDQKWAQEPTILQQIGEYETFYDYGVMILAKRTKGLYYNLPHCCETLNIDVSDIKFHRAGADVTATYRVRSALASIILG